MDKNKVKLTAKELEVIKVHMQSALRMSANERDAFIARTIGDVYDVEFPIPEVIESISRTERADVGEHVYYMTPEAIVKTLHTLTSNCTVTQTKISPSTRTELTWTDIISPEFYICLHDWLKGDHDVLTFYADSISEAMDRQEIYAVLQLIDAGAVAESNTFTLTSGATKFDFPKLVEMARSVARYGRELVLITGANVTTDIVLMDYDADKNRETSIGSIVGKHIPVEELAVTVDASPVTVIDPDIAYLVAVADAKANKPVLFARRKTSDLATSADTTGVDKERIVIDQGNLINVASARKFSRSKTGFQEYGAILINSKVVAKFTRS
jgi:hypothetical protein